MELQSPLVLLLLNFQPTWGKFQTCRVVLVTFSIPLSFSLHTCWVSQFSFWRELTQRFIAVHLLYGCTRSSIRPCTPQISKHSTKRVNAAVLVWWAGDHIFVVEYVSTMPPIPKISGCKCQIDLHRVLSGRKLVKKKRKRRVKTKEAHSSPQGATVWWKWPWVDRSYI